MIRLVVFEKMESPASMPIIVEEVAILTEEDRSSIMDYFSLYNREEYDIMIDYEYDNDNIFGLTDEHSARLMALGPILSRFGLEREGEVSKDRENNADFWGKA